MVRFQIQKYIFMLTSCNFIPKFHHPLFFLFGVGGLKHMLQPISPHLWSFFCRPKRPRSPEAPNGRRVIAIIQDERRCPETALLFFPLNWWNKIRRPFPRKGLLLRFCWCHQKPDYKRTHLHLGHGEGYSKELRLSQHITWIQQVGKTPSGCLQLPYHCISIHKKTTWKEVSTETCGT